MSTLGTRQQGRKIADLQFSFRPIPQHAGLASISSTVLISTETLTNVGDFQATTLVVTIYLVPADSGPMKSQHTSIVVDIRHIRCDNCKVALHDVLAQKCLVCGAVFDGVTSNHVGLADRLRQQREAARVPMSTAS
jgi:hypothetical protein